MRYRTFVSLNASKVLLWFVLQFLPVVDFAQGVNLYGLTSSGGAEGLGTIFKTRPDGSGFEIAYSFKHVVPGNTPYGSLLEYNGKLYGMTNYGGADPNSCGLIFVYDPDENSYTKLKDFNPADGMYPFGSLIEYNGKLYGMTCHGGASERGVIFSFDLATNIYTKLKDFNAADGAYPYGDLLEYNGKLYGMTSRGGTSDLGVLFSIDPAGSNFTVLKNMTYQTGTNPYGSLIEYNGLLYGMTSSGGAEWIGVIFSFNPATNTYTIQKDFSYAEGVGSPRGSLFKYNGMLYGMTSYGDFAWNIGSIFSFNPATHAFAILKILGWNDGCYPYGTPVVYEGKLYGMTSRGALNDGGTLYSFDLGSGVFTLEKYFYLGEGKNPRGNLIIYKGKLYGMTAGGGANDGGVLFSFDVSGGGYSKLKDFNEVLVRYPRGLTECDGKLYGLSAQGGRFNNGVIFSFDPVAGSFTKLKDFDYNVDGASPCGALIKYNGRLYGMTTYGGGGGGTVFSFDPVANNFATVKVFNFTDGAYPQGGGLLEYNDKLYGMAYRGGANDYGIIFSFDPLTGDYVKLKDFDSNDGVYPYGRLIEFEGKFYGMTSNWFSTGYGVIFSFDPETNDYIKLKEFNAADGAYPFGSLLEYRGELYGMTSRGGVDGVGVLFSNNLANNVYTKLKEFNSEDGRSPGGSLIEYNGKLYGSASGGGSNNLGVIFYYDPLVNTYLKIHDFTSLTGLPSSDLVVVHLPVSRIIENLITEIKSLGLGAGLENSLTVKLEHALYDYERCLLTTAVDQLSAFINQVEAQRGKKIPEDVADDLIVQAQEVIDYILTNGNPECPPAVRPIAQRAEDETTAANGLEQLDIFPNPFNGATIIQYQLPETGRISLCIYDQLGRLVRVLVSGKQPAGSHQIQWDDADPASMRSGAGVYLLRLQTENGNLITKRLIKTK